LKNLGNYTTKNFRTWNANIELIKNLMKSRNNSLSDCIKNVAFKLHHTPSVCKKNYIDPKLITYFEKNPNEFYSFFKGNIDKKYTKFLNLKY
jgi:DNA topoisomerase-1